MTADQRKIIADFMEVPYNCKLTNWNFLMPAVQKVGNELSKYWTGDVTEVWQIQTALEISVVNVRFEKTVTYLINAINFLKRQVMK